MGDRRTIKGQDHYLYVGRISHDPNTGRPILEVLQDDDEVLAKGGDQFVTFWAAQQLPRVLPTGPFAPPSSEAIQLAVRALADDREADALHRATRIVEALRRVGLDPDDMRVRTAAAVVLETIAAEMEGNDEEGQADGTD